MSKQDLEKRAAKIQARHTVAQQISLEHAKTRGLVIACLTLLNRGFFGRLKWLFLGR